MDITTYTELNNLHQGYLNITLSRDKVLSMTSGIIYALRIPLETTNTPNKPSYSCFNINPGQPGILVLNDMIDHPPLDVYFMLLEGIPYDPNAPLLTVHKTPALICDCIPYLPGTLPLWTAKVSRKGGFGSTGR